MTVHSRHDSIVCLGKYKCEKCEQNIDGHSETLADRRRSAENQRPELPANHQATKKWKKNEPVKSFYVIYPCLGKHGLIQGNAQFCFLVCLSQCSSDCWTDSHSMAQCKRVISDDAAGFFPSLTEYERSELKRTWWGGETVVLIDQMMVNYSSPSSEFYLRVLESSVAGAVNSPGGGVVKMRSKEQKG